MKWRYVPYNTYDPYWNIAIDEAMLIACSEGKVPPTIRFYGWQPASLSIGYFQRTEREIDRRQLDDLGLGFVRRMTGGRTVYHDQELTYSVIVSEDNPSIASTIHGTYRLLNFALQKGLEGLGLTVDQTHEVHTTNSSAACFDAPGESEFLIEGRKVIGSAQTRQRGVLLQHGSILIDLDLTTLLRIFRFPNESVKNNFQNRIGTLSQLKNRPVALKEVIESFYHGFQAGLQIELLENKLTAYEMQLAQQLVTQKYSQADWNEKR